MKRNGWEQDRKAVADAHDLPRRSGPLVVAVALTLILVATTACGRGSGDAEIQTSIGTMVITEVGFSEEWPPDCGDVSPTCSRAEPGYKILVVWLESKDAEPIDVSGELSKNFSKLSVVDSEGERTKGFAGGMASSRALVAFTPPESSSGFTLHWPENQPIELDV